MRTSHWIWLLACLIGSGPFGPAAARADKPEGLNLPPQQLADQMYCHLKDRYVIKKYALDQTGRNLSVNFLLEDGRRLTYDRHGHLLKRLQPDGRETYFKNGYPVREVSARGDVLSVTDYAWTPEGRIKRALRHEGPYLTASFYNQEGDIHFELRQGPQGRLYRYNYSWSDNRRTYKYFETRSWDASTDYYSVSAETGLVEEHWRVSQGMREVWDERYELFMALLLAQFRRDYADRRRLKSDSLGRTRGDILLGKLHPRSLYPVKRFVRDYKHQKIIFAEDWRFIECLDIRLRLPVVKMVEEAEVVAQRVRTQGDKVYTWVPERRRWERYPFDSREEKLIPINLRGDARIETRYAATRWEAVPNQAMDLIYSVRLIVPQQKLAQQRLALSQHVYDDPDFDDLYALLQQSAVTSGTGRRAIMAPIGASVTKLTPAEAQILQREIIYKIKQELQIRPQMNRRDSNQKTQAELIIYALNPETMLPRRNLLQQLDKLHRVRRETFDLIGYSNLTVLMPRVKKEKDYTILDRVQRVQNVIKIWETDGEHPEGGYWLPYTLRPGRDKLTRGQGKWRLRVDEGCFRWSLTELPKIQRVSGFVVLARPPASAPTVARESGLASGAPDVRPDPTKPGAGWRPYVRAALPSEWQGWGFWGRVLAAGVLGAAQGRGGEVEMARSRLASGEKVAVFCQRAWTGQTNGFRRVLSRSDQWFSEERYDANRRLVSFQDLRGVHGEVKMMADGRRQVHYRYQGRTRVLEFNQARLESVILPDRTRRHYLKKPDQTKIRYEDENGDWVFERNYDLLGKQRTLIFAHGEEIRYQYLSEPGRVKIHISDTRNQRGSFVLNEKGQISQRRGNGNLVYFAVNQLQFVRPDCYQPLEIQFTLPLN